MWARRCGCRPLWPSRVKVLLQSLGVALVGVAFFRFMIQIDIAWLDLESPILQHPICMSHWPLRHKHSTWLEPDIWIDWAIYRLETKEWIASHMCANATRLEAMLCDNAQIPVKSAQQHLGMPIGSSYVYANDFIEVFAHLLMLFSVCLWAYMTIHDLALTSMRNRNYILDVHGIKDRFPCVMRIWVLLGMRHLRRLAKGKVCGSEGRAKIWARIACCLLIPPVIVWDALVCTFVLLPAVVLVSACHPIKVSRAMTVFCCLALSIVGVALVVFAIVFLGAPQMRQSYAVTWHVDGCVCGCSYPVLPSGFTYVLVLGVGIIYKSLTIAHRCLKGLRRSNWASLISVLFPVPLNVYSVRWKRADGSQVQRRKKGEPVQGELAFDPFTLMDQQPESAMTCLTLRPTLIKGAISNKKFHEVNKLRQSITWDSELTPREQQAEFAAASYKSNDSFVKTEGTEYVGCLGFPCIKRSDKTVRGAKLDLEGAAEIRAVASDLREQASQLLECISYLEHTASELEGEAPANSAVQNPTPKFPVQMKSESEASSVALALCEEASQISECIHYDVQKESEFDGVAHAQEASPSEKKSERLRL